MNDKEYDRERRRQARLERLGSNNPLCVISGEDDPRCLELHHLAGKAFADDCVIVSSNHHRKLSDMQKDHPPILKGVPDTLECCGRLLLGIADALELCKAPGQLVDLIRQTGERLIECGQHSRNAAGGQS